MKNKNYTYFLKHKYTKIIFLALFVIIATILVATDKIFHTSQQKALLSAGILANLSEINH